VAKLIKASSLEKLERTDEAIQAYEVYNTAYPGSVDVIGSLAKLYETKGDKAKAEAYKKEFQAKGGKVSGETYNSGVKAYQAGDFAKATDLFEKSIKEDPNDADAHRELARSLVQLQKYQETIDQLKIYLKMKPSASDAQTWQAAISGLEAMIQQQEAEKQKKKK
jgi:tetratricopeptide (TPR) repeat protein